MEKKCVIKKKIKFENHKNCLEATRPENKKKISGKNETDVDTHKNIIKNS